MIKTSKRAWGFVAIAACAWTLASAATGQTPCEGSTGPDVIVGELTGPANYNTIGGLDALAIGTISCNQGDTNLDWIAGDNRHPVIGGELYRYKVVNGAGRFEQVGLSWLKHGFYALSQGTCCSGCQGSPDGTYLGVRCSDPYTAQRNGTQSGLGPRWQVNANTGAFTYPPPHPTGGNTGRIEVDIADLTGSRYFASAQYVTKDDSAAGNQNNNTSSREVVVSGTSPSFTFSYTGSTQREVPAIVRWQACESGVTVQNVQLPSEGRLMLGYKVTALGGGVYHYEYALYNQNSDLSVQSFSLPISAGVSITNAGFHDVTYRGGDGNGGVNFSGTDWTFTNTGSSLDWATQSFASNPNANAVRWATTYNFRFDANVAPVAGTITLGTFKQVGSAPVAADVPGNEPGPPGISFCSGDGTLSTFCPCLNFGDAGNGCANSQNPGGANLSAAGTTSPDTVVLTAMGELPTSLTIFLQGDAQNPNGVVFGDGLRCVAGDLKRLYNKSASGGVVAAPTGGDPSITNRSAALGDPIAPGSTRYYMTYYRDPDTVFCPAPTGNTFNSTNGQIIAW